VEARCAVGKGMLRVLGMSVGYYWRCRIVEGLCVERMGVQSTGKIVLFCCIFVCHNYPYQSSLLMVLSPRLQSFVRGRCASFKLQSKIEVHAWTPPPHLEMARLGTRDHHFRRRRHDAFIRQASFITKPRLVWLVSLNFFRSFL